MKTTRRKFTAAFKAKVAIEALKERETIQQIAARYEIHPGQVSQWKRQFLEGAEAAFGETDAEDKKKAEEEKEQLFKKIGKLQVQEVATGS